jgi:tetratricopeptide (TPR) repeat protein
MFGRAKEVLEQGNFEYAIHLLLNACKLDPTNLPYRRALRKATKARHENNPRGRGFGFFTTSKAKAKLKAAKAARDHLKVLEHGEELLAVNPRDAGTHKEMAAAAEALGRLDLAVWLLEHAWHKDVPDVAMSRTLARLYERRGNNDKAIELWEVVRKADPNDLEASRKARDLAAADTIARTRYTREAEDD